MAICEQLLQLQENHKLLLTRYKDNKYSKKCNKEQRFDRKKRVMFAIATLIGAVFLSILLLSEPRVIATVKFFLAVSWITVTILLLFSNISTSKLEKLGFGILTGQFVFTDLLPLLFKDNVQDIYLEVFFKVAWVFLILMSLALILFKLRVAILFNVSLGVISIILISWRVLSLSPSNNIYVYLSANGVPAVYNWHHLILIFIITTIILHVLAHFKGLAQEVQHEANVVRELAYLDSLTGLPNRRAISEVLERKFLQQQKNSLPLSLVLIDIDNFKKINDIYGHNVGDKILQEVAKLMKQSIRVTDWQNNYCGRWGGEEFLYILPNVDLQNAYEISDRLRSTIAEHSFDNELIVTASFGVASLSNQKNPKELVKCADDALYEAKMSGRNKVSVWLPVTENC